MKPLLALFALALCLLAGCDAAPAPPATVDLVQDVAMLATGAPLPAEEADREAASLMDGRLGLDAWLDRLLDDPRLGETVAKGIIIGGIGVKALHPVTEHSILHTDDKGGAPLYYLKDHCDRSDAVSVSPWWAPKSTVLVCPSAYRPDVLGDEEGRSCGASTVNPYLGGACGCGPRLIFCTRDRDQYEALRQSATAELDDTLALVINQDLPIEQLYLMNESVRDRNAEFLYRRARILAGEPDDLVSMDGFGSKARLAPRTEVVEGQEAGVLSMPALVYGSDALRGTMRNYYDVLWCSGSSSSRVTTAAVLGLSVVNLREGDGWKQLAAMNICTDCHARLDYGMQFFAGFPSSTRGIDYRPSLAHEGDGPLYNENIGDPRGEAPLNPRGFARLAVTQPEFGDCLTRKVVNYVFSGASDPDDIDAVRQTFDDEHSFRAMMRTALRRFVVQTFAQSQGDSPAPVATAVSPALVSPALVSLDATHAALENGCLYCHDGVDAQDLSSPDRGTELAMLEQVSFGLMPPNPGDLYPDERAALQEGLIEALWDSDADRASARSFYLDGMRAYAAHGYRTSLKTATLRAGGDDAPAFKSIEGSVSKELQRYSPGFAATTGLAALETCKAEHKTGAELQECVRVASDPSAFMVGDPQGP